MRSIIGRAIIVALIGLIPLTALSQDNPSEQDQPEHRVIEEITVTARKRAENVEKVPITATVFSEKDIAEADIESVADFVHLTPNVSFEQSQNPGNVTMTVRGISQVRNGDAPFAVVIDGVFQGSPNSINQSLFDIERIEVLKGPQGALYGRSAIGGVVSIVTRAPTAQPEHRVAVGYGREREVEIRLGSSGALSDNLFYRVSGLYRDRDGYFTNQTVGEDADPKTDEDIRARLSYLPNDRFSLDFSVSASDTEDGGAYYIPVFTGDSNETDTSPQSELLPSADRDLRDYSVRADYQTDYGKLTLIGAVSEVDEQVFADEYLNVSAVWALQDLAVTSELAELRFTSPDDRRFRWVLGASYLQTDRFLATIVDLDVDNDGSFDLTLPREEENDNQATSFFGQMSYDITDEVEVSLALRRDDDDRDQLDLASGNSRAETFGRTQPRLSIAWEPVATSMVYATYAEGYRSGGFNAPGIDLFPAIFEAEETEALEAGFKATWLDRRIKLEGAVFSTDFANQQFYVFDGNSGSQGLLNIDESTVTGLELQLQAIAAMGFRFNASLGTTETEIDAFTADPSLVGNKTPNSNEHTGNLSVIHQTNVGNGHRFLIRGDYRREGERYWAVNNDHKRDPIDLLDLSMRYEAPNWSLRLYLDNATDERYNAEFLQGEFSGTPYDIRFPALPRRYGLELEMTF